MNSKVRLAIDDIELRKADFHNAEESALFVMKLILEKCGEEGVL